MGEPRFYREVPVATGDYLAVREPCNGDRGVRRLVTVLDARSHPADLTSYDWFYGPLPVEMLVDAIKFAHCPCGTIPHSPACPSDLSVVKHKEND